jgi:hypothetical protein
LPWPRGDPTEDRDPPKAWHVDEGGDHARSFATLARHRSALLLAGAAHARSFVLPHVLEKSGTITNTQFTFDTTIFANYVGGVGSCPAGQPCAFVELYLFNEATGEPLQGANAQSVCNPCNYTLGSGDEGSEPAPRKRSITLDTEIEARGGGFPNSNVITGFAMLLVNGDFANTSIQGFVTNAKTGPLDLAVFGFEPTPIEPFGAPLAAGLTALDSAPRAASGGTLGASRRLEDIREDQGTVATTPGAYDTSISIFYLDAWFGPLAPATGVDIDFFNGDGSPMLGADGQPYAYEVANLALVAQPVILELETQLFGGVAPGAPGKRGYATVTLTGALPERVDVTSFVRKAVTGPSDLDPDGFYEQALTAPEASGGVLAALASLALLARRRT